MVEWLVDYLVLQPCGCTWVVVHTLHHSHLGE